MTGPDRDTGKEVVCPNSSSAMNFHLCQRLTEGTYPGPPSASLALARPLAPPTLASLPLLELPLSLSLPLPARALPALAAPRALPRAAALCAPCPLARRRGWSGPSWAPAPSCCACCAAGAVEEASTPSALCSVWMSSLSACRSKPACGPCQGRGSAAQRSAPGGADLRGRAAVELWLGPAALVARPSWHVTVPSTETTPRPALVSGRMQTQHPEQAACGERCPACPQQQPRSTCPSQALPTRPRTRPYARSLAQPPLPPSTRPPPCRGPTWCLASLLRCLRRASGGGTTLAALCCTSSTVCGRMSPSAPAPRRPGRRPRALQRLQKGGSAPGTGCEHGACWGQAMPLGRRDAKQ